MLACSSLFKGYDVILIHNIIITYDVILIHNINIT